MVFNLGIRKKLKAIIYQINIKSVKFLLEADNLMLHNDRTFANKCKKTARKIMEASIPSVIFSSHIFTLEMLQSSLGELAVVLLTLPHPSRVKLNCG